MDLLKGPATHCTTLPSGLFLEGTLSWCFGWPCTYSVFSWWASNYPPKLHPVCSFQTANFPCGPASGMFRACFVALIPILWPPEHPLGHWAGRLGVDLQPPCQGQHSENDAPEGVLTAGASPDMPPCSKPHTEASVSAGRAPEWGTLELLFLSSLQILQE